LDTASVAFYYTGAEGFWTTGDSSWMVYVSHENSITFGGRWLIEHMQKSVPLFEKYIYKGFDPSLYV